MPIAICSKCRYREAHKASAYCLECQPLPVSEPTGEQNGCGVCGIIFATLSDFDSHQIKYQKGHESYGMPTGECLEPVYIGLEVRKGVWGTPEGNRSRDRKAEALRASHPPRRA